MTETDLKTTNAMKTFGGGFLKALATAYCRADYLNRAVIRRTWSLDWRRYERMAEQLDDYEDREQEIEDAKFAPKEVLAVDEPMPFTRLNPKDNGPKNDTT